MDLAEYRTLFVLSFTTPAFDSDVAPSFGTLMATINVALSMLGEVVQHFPLFFSCRLSCYFIVIYFIVFCLDWEEERAGCLLWGHTSTEVSRKLVCDSLVSILHLDLISLSPVSGSRSLLMFSMENCFYVLISQAVRCLKDPSVLPRDKQRLKQELSSELVSYSFKWINEIDDLIIIKKLNALSLNILT